MSLREKIAHTLLWLFGGPLEDDDAIDWEREMRRSFPEGSLVTCTCRHCTARGSAWLVRGYDRAQRTITLERGDQRADAAPERLRVLDTVTQRSPR